MNLFILNDVSTGTSNFIPDIQSFPDQNGINQSIEIAKKIQTHLKDINLIVSSKMNRIKKLTHNIRTLSPSAKLAGVKFQSLHNFDERSFGVLTGSQFSFDSDLFQHTRICVEEGESIAQVRERTVSAINKICKKDNILLISHPFACQILFNSLLSKKHTLITNFWMSKGSLCQLKYDQGKYGLNWDFISAVNLLQDQKFSLKDIITGVVCH